MRETISLYMCGNAYVKGSDDNLRILCRVGKKLNVRGRPTVDGTKDGYSYLSLMRGEPLALKICRNCLSFDDVGGMVAKDDRGWLSREESG